ncbi:MULTISPECIES: RNA polymerase sigma factor [Brevibacillus]|jgi:RNA polymerase sigma factor, sigma-70 family|uniref:RNA polymerase ECF-type sigma factor n=1 Tax=Brevibacillus borstelensis AK1 TaxID=1300222 RepID=M8E752_9BACL|nr:RNA polymerase sigma factor [Brevibacillus borstelensis]EMT51290.1 RNA polymerase ECF-type sigma factor [Brevibacillus borstelensis AK1]KKX53300.1 RNA polymerase [Brevibacillus borstelensis cifa_chp40]MBE5395549.1 RNA polymerase sigma factor [Brevibacillus borstelensis]MCC0565154.1 RNA polymerase sigma factor [Brevibacillus borstelensis]MCM3472418.1 RNA polymerase sigma factor [Brevibacillus borstelensis]
MQDDKMIVDEVLRGNKEAFAQIIQKYNRRITLLIRKMLGQPPHEQDIAQEIFIKVYYHLGDYNKSYEFGAWLYRIATNHCFDELRSRKRSIMVTNTEVELATSHTPEAEYLVKEQNSYLQDRIKALDSKHRVVLEMRYLQYMSYEEISKKLGVPISTVRTRLSRGKTKLKEALTRRGKGGDCYL